MPDISSLSDEQLQSIVSGKQAALPAAGPAAQPTTPDISSMSDADLEKIANPTKPSGKASYGSAVEYGLVNAIPFGKDIGSAVGAAESYLPSALQVPGDVSKDVASQDTFGQRFAKTKAMVNAQEAANYAEYPKTSFLTPLAASAAALPVAGPIEAASAGLSRLAPGMAAPVASALATGTVGAGYGALYGAGSGDTLADRLRGAEVGATLGGVGGAAAPALARGVSSVVGGALNLGKGLLNPAAAGQEAAIGKIAADRAAGLGRLSDADVASAQASGQPIVAGDLGGNATLRSARAIANKSPEAQQEMMGPLSERFQTQNQRAMDVVSSWYGGNIDAVAAEEAGKAAGRTILSPLYKKAMADGASGIWDTTPDIQSLVNAPSVQTAINGVNKIAADDAALHGTTPIKSPFVTDAAGNMTLATDPTTGARAVPTLQFWDYVKRGLDTQIGAALRAGDSDGARRLGDLKGVLISNLDNAVPSYAAARSAAASQFRLFGGADNALDAGRNILKTSTDPATLQRTVAAMTPNEQKVLSYGAASAVTSKLMNSADNRDIVNLFNTPAMRQKLQAAMGPQADQLEAYLRVEGTMNALMRKVSGNSTSMEQAHDLGSMFMHSISGPIGGAGMGAAEAYREEGFDPWLMAKYGALGFMGGALRKAYTGQNAKMFQNMAETFASGDPATQAAVIKRMASDKASMQAIRSFSNGIIGATSAAAPEVTPQPRPQLQQPQPAFAKGGRVMPEWWKKATEKRAVRAKA